MASERTKGAAFTAQTLAFLKDLAANNDREWFRDNQTRYEALVRTPALDFITAMAPKLRSISRHFDAVAKRSGGSLMRVHRDTRFSSDKTPYKTNVGIQFRHERGRDVHAPGFYVHIEPSAAFVGAGLWRPDSDAQRAIRQEISEQPKAWRNASRNKRFTEHFSLAGESLQRVPRGFAADHPLLEDIKRKDFIAIASLSDRQVCSPSLAATVTQLLRHASPLMAFLCGAIDLEY